MEIGMKEFLYMRIESKLEESLIKALKGTSSLESPVFELLLTDLKQYTEQRFMIMYDDDEFDEFVLSWLMSVTPPGEYKPR